MSVQDKDDALCREKGWPTVSEQQKHWRERDATMLHAFDAIRNTIKNLTEAVNGLNKICEYHEQEINKLKRKL